MTADAVPVATLLAYLQRLPVIARLRSDLSVAELIEIGDALLAAPILVVEVALDFPDAYAAIGEFRRRYGEHMLIGAAEVVTLDQLQAAQEVGAHFFVLPRLDTHLLRFGRQHQLSCLPHVATPAAAQFAYLEGCPLVSVAVEPFLAPAATRWPDEVTFIITDAEDEATLAASWAAGAAALRLQHALFPTPVWSSASIITRARQWRQTVSMVQR